MRGENSENYMIEYVPQRFYHRYARVSDDKEKEFSNKMIVDAISKEGIDRIFLNHIESGRAHAFCARK